MTKLGSAGGSFGGGFRYAWGSSHTRAARGHVHAVVVASAVGRGRRYRVRGERCESIPAKEQIVLGQHLQSGLFFYNGKNYENGPSCVPKGGFGLTRRSYSSTATGWQY